MAGVFLSYDRRDNARIKPIAIALEKAGHSVWWDLHVRGGAQFAKVIEEALRQADAVVVLWSSHSVESAWVRDEATAGRDSGRLIPIALDGTEPPLGFRQYQTIDMSRRTGRGTPDTLRTLLLAIDQLVTEEPRVSDAKPELPLPEVSRRAMWTLAVAFLSIIALAIITIWRPWAASDVPTVAVAAADNIATDKELARGLMVSLIELNANSSDSMRLLDSADAGKPDFKFEVASINEPGSIGASVVLSDVRNRSIMWSRAFRQPEGKEADLKQQLSFTSARVLSCVLEAVSAKPPLQSKTLKLLLTGCATAVEIDDPRTLLPMFRQIVQEEPRFAGGWKALLVTEAQIVATESYPESGPMAGVLRQHITEARNLQPGMPEATWAEIYLNLDSPIGRRMELLEPAVADHPEEPILLSVFSEHLGMLGREREAADYAKRAADLAPLEPDLLAAYVTMLGWSGQKEAAVHVLEAAERRWPGASSVVDARWRYHLRFGDPKEALRLMRSGQVSSPGLESYLAARIDPTPLNIDRAIADATSQAKETPRAIGTLIQTLGEFGREDEIYERLLNGPPWDPNFVNQAIFRPALRKFRQDPRVMEVAKKSGVLDYWVRSGKWPDFCSEPDLPYDCRREAAKLKAA